MDDAAIVAVETCTSSSYPQLVHVLVETSGGAIGLGETFHRAKAVASYIHEVAAPSILGENGLNLSALRRALQSRFDGGNVWAGTATIDSSAVSAIDVALWDLRGKVYGAPLCDLLGGRVRDAISVYNTCSGPGEGFAAAPKRGEKPRLVESWGLGGPAGQLDDFRAMTNRPAELARELLSEGIRAMKLYTFRPAARATHGAYISRAQLDEAIAPLRAIREAVGSEMELILDLVFDWTLAPAQRILASLEEFDLLWIEDPLRWGARRHHLALQQQTRTPIAAFDYAAGFETYLSLVERGGLSIMRIDPQWVGGVSEAVRIAALADAVGLGVVFHDCTGPVNFAVGTHLAVHAPTTVLQESVRGYWRVVYPRIVTASPSFENGRATPPQGSGIGLELSEEYLALADLERTRSELTRGGLKTRTVSG